jgi:hypothetical protein
MLSEKDLKRFLAKVDKSRHQRCRDYGCWMWTAGVDKSGYGRFHCDKRNLTAHSISYRQFKGAVSKGLVVRHLCPYEDGDTENRRCVNPDHLEVGTHKENISEGYNWQRRKTCCPRCGSDYVVPKNRGRFCRSCHNEKQRAYYRKRQHA